MIVTGPSRSTTTFSPVICSAGDAVGDFVRLVGPTVGVVYEVTKADPSNALTMPAVGTLVRKLTATTGIIQKQGLCAVSGVPAVTIGKIVFVGLDSKATTIPPAAGSSSTQFSMIQAIGVAAAVDKVELQIHPMFVKTRI
jgi:hypothetical protein